MQHLQHAPLLLSPLMASIVAPDRGAIATFSGLVRDHHAGRSVVSLTYTAYEPMAEALCDHIVAEAEAKFIVRAALQHRLGDVPIGEAAVIIAASSAHRSAAFDAVRWIIDEVKSRVPIWKRERYADGSEAWVDPTAAGGTVPAKASS
jgi:molybdopterin synthase catalytic subunit